MYIRILAFLTLAFVSFVTPSWAATCTPTEETSFCSNIVSPTDPTAIFDFTGSGNGYLAVQFDTVLTTFTLTVTYVHTINPLDPNEFPTGTVCVQYSTNGGQCDQYDFTGSAGGPNGVPVKNIDYKGLITLTLSYFTSQTAHNPAFGHAPGDNATAVYTVDILTNYDATNTICPSSSCDPTMGGKTPDISPFAAFDEPLINPSTFCSLTVTPTTVGNGQKPQEEVTFKIVSGSDCSAAGQRDKTARVSVSTFDASGNFSFPALKNVEGNKFHWDNKNGVNEYDISTDGLVSGQTYYVTVFSTRFSPQQTTFIAP